MHNKQLSSCHYVFMNGKLVNKPVVLRPFRKNVHGQKTLSYLGPKTWNSLPAQIKLCKNVNSFKHDIKNLYFKRLQKSDDSIFMYY